MIKTYTVPAGREELDETRPAGDPTVAGPRDGRAGSASCRHCERDVFSSVRPRAVVVHSSLPRVPFSVFPRAIVGVGHASRFLRAAVNKIYDVRKSQTSNKKVFTPAAAAPTTTALPHPLQRIRVVPVESLDPVKP